MFCPNCGTESSGKFCPNCGTNLEVLPKDSIKITSEKAYIEVKDPKGKWATFFLCLFLGAFGAHRFYTKKYKSGILYLILFLVTGFLLGDPLFIFPFIIYDLFTILTNSFFLDRKQMVEIYNSKEHHKTDSWLIAFIVLVVIFLISVFGIKNTFDTTVLLICGLGIPIFGVISVDDYRKGKSIAIPLALMIVFFIPVIIQTFQFL